MVVTKLVAHIYFRLLQHPSQSTRQAAVQLIVADLRAQLTAATEEGRLLWNCYFIPSWSIPGNTQTCFILQSLEKNSMNDTMLFCWCHQVQQQQQQVWQDSA